MSSSMGRMPDFLILGAAKAGTTSLAAYLSQHPEIFMSPIKEPGFFAFEGQTVDFRGPGDESINRRTVTRMEDYQNLFAEASPGQKCGEASVVYLYDERAPERIHYHVPHVKLIVVLRNPVDRAYSSYLYQVSRGREPAESFEAALDAEPERICEGWQHIWHYTEMGFYGRQLERYLRRFDRSQLQVHLYNRFRRDTEGVVRDVFEFLEVNPYYCPDLSRRHAPSGRPRLPRLHAFLIQPRKLKRLLHRVLPNRLSRRIGDYVRLQNLKRPSLNPETRCRLLEVFSEDFLWLEELLETDLSHWRAHTS